MLLSNVERFSVLVARSQSGNDSTEPVRISRPNIGELSAFGLCRNTHKCFYLFDSDFG